MVIVACSPAPTDQLACSNWLVCAGDVVTLVTVVVTFLVCVVPVVSVSSVTVGETALVISVSLVVVMLGVVASMAAGGSPARHQSIRTMNEQLLLEHIRRSGELSRADLARISSLSKPTVSGALANLERAGLVRTAGVRSGVPGPAAVPT